MKMTIKNLADFKRALKVGVMVGCVYHCKAVGRDHEGKIIYGDESRATRLVSIVQSNSFALKTEQSAGAVDSWCAFPKAKECKIQNDCVTILEPDYRFRDKEPQPMIPVLTYWIESDGTINNS